MIKIGLIGSQSMHGWAFAAACNHPGEDGNDRFPGARVTAVYGVDDTEEHIKETMEKGNIPTRVSSLDELYEHCNAFMILQRKGGEHMKYAAELIKKGYPVFIDKPICNSYEDMNTLKLLAEKYDAVIIVSKNSIDTAFLETVLGIEKCQSYKNSRTGKAMVIDVDKFRKQWEEK